MRDCNGLLLSHNEGHFRSADDKALDDVNIAIDFSCRIL